MRALEQLTYLPILALKPAEMRALEELPNRTKDLLLPLVPLRPWVGAHHLHNALKRLSDAYGDRPIVVALGDPELPNDRPVHGELAHLRIEDAGFANWCDFVRQHANFIPAVQFGAVAEEEAQIACLHALDRGLFVIVERTAFPVLPQVAQRVGRLAGNGRSVCFVLDFGVAARDHLQVAQYATNLARTVREHAPEAFVALSASSFPDQFVDRVTQPIYERRLYDEVARQPGIERLIYSDRGSARVERINGGGGQPAPRIDYPLPADWNFYRSDLTGFAGYREQANRLIRLDDVWSPALRVWGTQMIERTAAGDTSAISGPQKSTAARINIHLQRQTFYLDPAAAEDTDEDWDG